MTHEYSEEKENELILDYKNKKGDSKKKKPPLALVAGLVGRGFFLATSLAFHIS